MKVIIRIEEEIGGKEYQLNFLLHGVSEEELIETYRHMLKTVERTKNDIPISA